MPFDPDMTVEEIEMYKMDMLDMQADDYQAWIDCMERDYGDLE